MSIAQRAKTIGVSTRTIYSEVAAGRGPKITFISPKVRIIEDEPWNEWLLSRRSNPPAAVTDTPSPNPRARRNEAGTAAA
jgi:hypothetical protein